MPSEHPPSNNTSATGTRPTETAQPPATKGGVRALLGLPLRDSGVPSTVALTTPSAGHRYRQSLLPTPEEDEWSGDTADNEGFIEEVSRGVANVSGRPPHGIDAYEGEAPGSISRPRLRDGAPTLLSRQENTASAATTATAPSAAQREQTSFVIPGISTERTEFAALSHTSDTAKVTQQEESQEPSADKMAPRHALASLPHARETAIFDSEFLSKLEKFEHLVTEGAKARHGPEARRLSVTARSPSLVERMGGPNGARDETDVARRLTQLQRTVGELAATIAAQAAHLRDESHAQGRQRKTPPQRMVVVQRTDASSTTRAFWERSRLSRAHLRTGR
ncbi:MAG: hypothetical protein HOP18_18590 [Deltaproteobacteria bacterium]|nr:hypothetical protein [Deltaproteobacteria bacterium]